MKWGGGGALQNNRWGTKNIHLSSSPLGGISLPSTTRLRMLQQTRATRVLNRHRTQEAAGLTRLLLPSFPSISVAGQPPHSQGSQGLMQDPKKERREQGKEEGREGRRKEEDKQVTNTLVNNENSRSCGLVSWTHPWGL